MKYENTQEPTWLIYTYFHVFVWQVQEGAETTCFIYYVLIADTGEKHIQVKRETGIHLDTKLVSSKQNKSFRR